MAITKADLVDEPRRAAVTREVRALLRGTHLEFSPLVFTSVPTGEGMQQLRQELARLPAWAQAADADRSSHWWLPIDRVFTLAGHGTVVTGTLRGGIVRAGDAVSCLPRGHAGTVRQLQVHGEPAARAVPGQRVGLNLRHIHVDELSRGDVLAPPGRLRASVLLDVALRLLPPATRDHVDGRRVRLLIGTSEVAAVVRVLAPTAAGGDALAQLRCARPVVAVAGERFVLRRESPAATLGGGQVLDPAPARHARADRAAVQRLVLLAGGSANQRLLDRLRRAGAQGIAQAALAAEAGLPPSELTCALDGMAVVDEQRVWSADLVADVKQQLVDALARWHAEHPLRATAPLGVCRKALPPPTGEALARHVLNMLEREQRIVRRDGQVRLAGHDPLAALDGAARERLVQLSTVLRAAGMNPPDAPAHDDPRRALLELLVDVGEVLLLPGGHRITGTCPPNSPASEDQLACADHDQQADEEDDADDPEQHFHDLVPCRGVTPMLPCPTAARRRQHPTRRVRPAGHAESLRGVAVPRRRATRAASWHAINCASAPREGPARPGSRGPRRDELHASPSTRRTSPITPRAASSSGAPAQRHARSEHAAGRAALGAGARGGQVAVWWSRLVEGEPVPLATNGRLDAGQLERQGLSRADLDEALRAAGIENERAATLILPEPERQELRPEAPPLKRHIQARPAGGGAA